MEADDVLNRVGEVATVRQVFGEPYEMEGVRVVRVARLRGGECRGTGTSNDSERGGRCGDGALGVDARLLGADVIRDGRVRWQPALSADRIVLQGQPVAVVAALLVTRRVRRHRQAPPTPLPR